MRDQVQAELRRATPRIEIGDISTRDGQLSFMLRDPTQVDAAREKLLTIAGGGAGMTELAKTTNERTNQTLDGDTFMKLLVAQLKFQDPSKPMDTGEMMQQTASMSMVQRINEMATNIDSMVQATKSLAQTESTMGTSYAQMLVQQQMSSAVGLVGRKITYADATNPDARVDGVVDSVRFDKDGPILSVSGKDVPLSAVSAVKASSSSPSSAA